MIYKTVELSNGKKVGNFSSPHDFTFTDGTLLPRVRPEVAEVYKVTFIETVDDDGDVQLSFELSTDIWIRIGEWEYMWKNGEVDVVICPLPMITALKEQNYELKKSPFRTGRIEDRQKKLLSITKQCL